jgi:hypothetical protein
MPIVVVTLLAGCAASTTATTPTDNGVRDKTPQDIAALAVSTAKAETSLRIKGTGSCGTVGTFGADMSLRQDGTGSGTVQTAGGKVQVVTTPTDVYLQGPAAFWKTQATPTAVKQIGDKWVKAPSAANPCFAALGNFTDVLANYVEIPGTPTKVKSDRVLSVPAQLIQFKPDFSLWVATTGRPLPVYVSSPSTGLAMALGQWGKPVQVDVPSGSQVIDAATLVAK